MEITFMIMGVIFLAMGVILIYDARILTKKLFSFRDINEGAKTLKIIGGLMFILGIVTIYVFLPSALELLKNVF